MTDESTRAITTIEDYAQPGTLQPIDIEGEKAWLDSFRTFIDSVLDKSKGHFGDMPGVDKDFLLQPGAEIIYRALKCRDEPEILTEHIDWDRNFCAYIVRVAVVHIGSGDILGYGDGAATSDEFASTCYYIPVEPQKEMPFADCPVHGRHPARTWYDKGKRRRMQGCAKKVSRPLSQTLHNTLSKAKKRAYVAAIRHVGCVSELFTSDEELVTHPDDSPPTDTPGPHNSKAKEPNGCAPGPNGEACVKPDGHAGEHRTAQGVAYGRPPDAPASAERRKAPAPTSDEPEPEWDATEGPPDDPEYDMNAVIRALWKRMQAATPPWGWDHLGTITDWPEGADREAGIRALLTGAIGSEDELAGMVFSALEATRS